ncbi:MAG: outer membrane protein assembly factor BamA [Treponemataceae bacterium]|nr:outer membrane protein assembly factor BamA [Treponemataceae bacterium]
MRAKKGIIAVTLLFLLCGTLFAQAEDWYYGKTIKKISFSGCKVISSVELDGVVAPFKGQTFTDENWMDLLNRVYALDYFDDINVSLEPSDDSYSQVIIKFSVIEKPVIASIRFEGNDKVHNTELREAITLKKGDIFVGTKVLVDERKIRDTYLEKGYTAVKVTSDYTEGKKGIELVFTISEGTATIIRNISFEGNQLFTDKTLKGQLSLKESGLFTRGAFKESALEADRQTLLMYYLDRGFVDADIVDIRRETVWNDNKHQEEMDLTFVVREGTKYTFGGLTLVGNTLFTDKELMSLVTLRTGSDFNTTKYQNSMSAIADLYYENGYTSNNFIPQLERNTDTRVITCSLTIVERPRSHIENILVRGNSKTKEYVITREIPLEAGDIFSKTKLINGLRNLYNTQYFSSIDPEIVQGSEENLVDLIINVEEGQTNTLEMGITFTPTDIGQVKDDHMEWWQKMPISVFLEHSNFNVGGEGKTISEKLTLASTTQEIGFGYSNAWAFNKPVTFSANLNVSHSEETALQKMYYGSGVDTTHTYMTYEKMAIESAVSLGRRWYPMFGIFSVTGGVSSELVRNDFDSDLYEPVDSVILEYKNRLGMFNTVWGAVSIDDRDIYYDPSKGWFASQKLAFTGLLPNESDYFLRSDTKIEGYLPICNIPIGDSFDFKLTLAGFSSLTNLTPFFGDEISHSSTLFIDGMFNGRGWSTLAGTRGHTMWSNSVELRSPIVAGMVAADFYFDAVVLKDDMQALLNNTSLEDFYFSYGPGIRFSIQQFPLRLLFANTFQIKDGNIEMEKKGAFTLSFNIANR